MNQQRSAMEIAGEVQDCFKRPKVRLALPPVPLQSHHTEKKALL